jgi:hypothetical protein
LLCPDCQVLNCWREKTGTEFFGWDRDRFKKVMSGFVGFEIHYFEEKRKTIRKKYLKKISPIGTNTNQNPKITKTTF